MPLANVIANLVAERLEKRIEGEFAALRDALNEHAMQIELSSSTPSTYNEDDEDYRRLIDREGL